MNLMMLLEMASSGFGERVALKCGQAELSFGELFSAAGTMAAELRANGCTRMAVLDESSLAIPVALFASAWAGVPFVPLNYRLTGTELEQLLAQLTPVYLVTEPQRVDALARLQQSTVLPREDFLHKAQSGTASALAATPEWSMDPDEIAILLFTSGTTGEPKAAVIRHKHLVAYILGAVEFGAAAEDDAALVSVPPYHIAGMASIASSVYSGRRMVQLPSFTAEAWLELARSERITHAFVVPTMLARIVECLEGSKTANLPYLRALSYGGGQMPLPVIERAMRLFPDTEFTNAYGLTETSSTICVLGPEEHRAAASSDEAAVRRRLASVGRPLPSVELQVRDEEGNVLGAGEPGEIFVRGEQVSGEYLGRDTTVQNDGWFPTRDGGFVDDEGYVFLGGRIDDIIVRGGENISPGEIEDVLMAHPAVASAAVVGIPDEQWGQAVAAAVVLRRGQGISASDLQDWVKSRLRSSRTPQVLHFCDELPYNETGKLLRRVVSAELAGLTSPAE